VHGDEGGVGLYAIGVPSRISVLVRKVGCMGTCDQVPVGAEERTAVIESFFDVRRGGGGLECSSHGFCDRHEAVRAARFDGKRG
jgi:hypothetical protein